MTKEWIRAALIRAVKTMAQTAVALLGTGAVGFLDVDWISVLSASALAGILSILTSIAGLPEVGQTAEMTDEEVFDAISENDELADELEEYLEEEDEEAEDE